MRCRKNQRFNTTGECSCSGCWDNKRKVWTEERNALLVRYLTALPKTHAFVLSDDFILNNLVTERCGHEVIHFGVGIKNDEGEYELIHPYKGIACRSGGHASIENGRVTMHISKVTCGNCRMNLGRAAKEVSRN